MSTLSILVPTYNRANKLECLLQSLVPLVDLIDQNIIEIIISDNASTDSTRRIVDLFRQKYRIRYFRQSSNLGFDGNVHFLYSVQKSSWSLLVGDDDNVISSEVLRLVKLLHTTPKNQVLLIPSQSSFQGVLSKSWPNLTISDTTFNYVSALLLIVVKGLSRFGFIGCHVFPSTLVERYLASGVQPSCRYWTHLICFLFALTKRYSVTYTNIPVVVQCLDTDFHHYTCSRWSILFLQRLIAIYTLFVSCNRPKATILLLLLWFRESLAPTSVKEVLRYAVVYPHTYAFRLFQTISNLRQLLVGPIFIIRLYLLSFLVPLTLFSVFTKISKKVSPLFVSMA